MSLLKKIAKPLFGGSKSYNTYQAPDIDFLREAAPSVNYDFLRAPRTESQNRFDQWIGNINAPSSVDAVRDELSNERLNSTVDSIYRDTRDKFGKDLMASFGRGIFDPSTGADSDIARNSMAQIAASGARTAADARTTMGLGEIERLAGREKDARDAYGSFYGTESAADLSREGAYASGLAGNADREADRRKALANALLGIASGQSSGAQRTEDPGLLRMFSNEFVKSGGQTLGKRVFSPPLPVG
jgi:hypothetical protein